MQIATIRKTRTCSKRSAIHENEYWRKINNGEYNYVQTHLQEIGVFDEVLSDEYRLKCKLSDISRDVIISFNFLY